MPYRDPPRLREPLEVRLEIARAERSWRFLRQLADGFALFMLLLWVPVNGGVRMDWVCLGWESFEYVRPPLLFAVGLALVTLGAAALVWWRRPASLRRGQANLAIALGLIELLLVVAAFRCFI